MKINNYLCFAAFLVLVACTPKATETKETELQRDSVPENI